MISNRKDSLILIQFLQAIKERVGSLSPTWFMSDDAEQFFLQLGGQCLVTIKQKRYSVLGTLIELGPKD